MPIRVKSGGKKSSSKKSTKDKGKRGKDLNDGEINFLVNRVRNFDCEASFSTLRRYVGGWISVFSHKYRIAGCDPDEIEQECLYALRYKAIEDFDQDRGKFKWFALLCLKRHLFSIIKANNQQKRLALNESVSLNEDRSGDEENLSLANLIADEGPTVDEQVSAEEIYQINRSKLMSRLSDLEREVFHLRLQDYPYDEIVDELVQNKETMRRIQRKTITKKAVDNALQRCRTKAQEMTKTITVNA